MKVLAAGDFFIRPSVLREHLERRLKDVARDLEIRAIDWEFYYFGKKPESLRIKEYAGSPEKFKKEVGNSDIVIVHLAPITADIIDSDTSLKLIGCIRSGPVNVDIEHATKKNVPVLHAPGRNADTVADYTMGLILCESRNIARAHADLLRGNWRYDFYKYDLCGYELPGKTLGLVGLGTIGAEVAQRAKGFRMRLLVYDPYVSEDVVTSAGAKKVDLSTLLRESDYVSVHARLTSENRGLIGAEEFSSMKKTAYFINTARGGLVDQAALYEALKDKKIAGAALDVFEAEPIDPSHPLLKLPNVTVTPHVAGATKEMAEKGISIIAEDVRRFLLGERPKNCMNPTVLKP